MEGNEIERRAIAALARRFSATWEQGERRSSGRLTVGGRRVAVEVAVVPDQRSGAKAAAKARFRDDRVARRFLADLEAAVEERGPSGLTAILTLGAPIKLANRTLAALTDLLLDRLAAGPSDTDETTEILGNRARYRIVAQDDLWASKLVGFVFTGDPSPGDLADVMRTLRDAIAAHALDDVPAGRWLVLTGGDWIADIKTYRQAFARLSAPKSFEKILMAFDGCRLETLFERTDP